MFYHQCHQYLYTPTISDITVTRKTSTTSITQNQCNSNIIGHILYRIHLEGVEDDNYNIREGRRDKVKKLMKTDTLHNFRNQFLVYRQQINIYIT